MDDTRVLVGRWSRADRLGVAVVALTVAFLAGATLLGAAAGAETTGMAAGYGSTASVEEYDSWAAARAAASEDAVVLPLARVTVDGVERTVVGVDAEARSRASELGVQLPPPRTEATAGGNASGTVLHGTDGTATISGPVASGRTAVPPSWYVARPSTVERLGESGALVVSPSDGSGGGTPLRGVLPFLAAGAGDLLALLGVLGVAVAVLAGVTVHSVARIAVRDRRTTIAVALATGARPRRVVGALALRGAGLAAAGALVGTALGIVLANGLVSAAVAVGLPTTLSPRISAPVATVLGGTVLGVVAAGTIAAWLAARRVRIHPPAALLRGTTDGGVGTGRLPAAVAPRLLGWRALVPTTATLSVFLVLAVVAWSAVGVLAPLVTTGGVVTEAGASHPVASSVPAEYADALEATGARTSPEILSFAVVEGEPVVVRGAGFADFSAVTGATLAAGREPAGPGEAVVGADLAARIDVEPGETVVLGGGTRRRFARVRIVGTFAAPGAIDDQLLVSLSTGRHLADVADGAVQFVRVAGGGGEVAVAGLVAPDRVPAEESAPIEVVLANAGSTARSVDLRVSIGGRTVTRRVSVDPGIVRRTLRVPTPSTGTYDLRVSGPPTGSDDLHGRLRVVDPTALVIEGLPDRVPPNASPLVRVTTVGGTPVANATLAVGATTRSTAADGRVRVPMPASGPVTVTAAAGSRTVTREVVVDDAAGRRLAVSLSVRPRRPPAGSPHAVRVGLENPWNRTLTRTVALRGPGGTVERTATVGPGERRRLRFERGARPPGRYRVEVAVGGHERARTTVTVSGDRRLASAAATGGVRTGTSGVGAAVSAAVGNLRVLLGGLVVLAGATTVGSAAAAFAAAVRARRRTIAVHRAVGATRATVLIAVLRDALVVGATATVLAVPVASACLLGASRAGVLSLYGIDLRPVPSPTMAGVVAIGALVVVGLAAAVPTAAQLRRPPGRTFAGEDHRGPGDRDE